MKAGWEVVALRDLCAIARGGSPRPIKEFITDDPNGINWIKIGDTKMGGRYIDSTEQKIKPEGISRSRYVEAGSFLLSNSMSFGRPYILRTNGCIHDGWLVLEPDYSRVDQGFLYFVLGSRTVFDQFDKLAAGSTVRNLNIGLVEGVEIPLPPLEEQQRIVAVLDEAFEGLARARAHATANLQNARELFERRLSGLFDAIETECNGVTINVEALGLPEKGSIRTGPFGSQLLHSEFTDQGIAVLGIDNAVNNEFRWGKSRFISMEKYKQMQRYTVRPGDVIITIMGTCGRCAVVPDDIPTAINTKHLCCISLDQAKCLPEYLHAYFLHSPTAREYLEANASGAVMAGLNMGLIKALPVHLPPLPRQSEVANTFAELKLSTNSLVASFQQKLQDLDDLRQSLLQKAFAGELT